MPRTTIDVSKNKRLNASGKQRVYRSQCFLAAAALTESFIANARRSPPLGDVADIDAGIVIRFRVVDCFDQLASVTRPRPSRSFFLLTSDRRHSASVSEILNVERCSDPIDLSRRSSLIHSKSQTRGSETPGDRKSRDQESRASATTPRRMPSWMR